MKIVSLVIFLFLIFLSLKTSFVYAHESIDNVVIHMNKDSYEPDSIKITVGTKVIFENTSEYNRWPAVDDHPTHMDYDGSTLSDHCGSNIKTFDSCSEILPGSEWSFVFNKTGKFEYHDHLAPHIKGVIVVEDSDTVDDSAGFFRRIINSINNLFLKIKKVFFYEKKDISNISFEYSNISDSEYEIFKSKYLDLVKYDNPKKAIEDLESDALANAKLSSFCHEYLHEIGRSSYKKYRSFESASIYQSNYCNSGYIHGVFEEYFKDSTDILNDINNQCSKYAAGKSNFELWQCYHGVGHGFMYFNNGDLEKSIELCESLGSHEKDCINGVYMEVFNGEIVGKESSYFTENKPEKICQQSTYKGDCYIYLPTYFLKLEGDYSESFSECSNILESSYKLDCKLGVVAEFTKRNWKNPSSAFDLCENYFNKNNIQDCVSSIVNMYSFQTGKYDEEYLLCEDLHVNYKNMCVKSVDLTKQIFSSN